MNLSLVVLLFLFFFAFGQCWHLSLHHGYKLLQTLVLASENSFLPYEHFVELAVGYQHLIKAAQVLCLVVHDTEHPEAIAGHRLDGVAVQRQTLQIVKSVQFPCLFKVRDVVTMHVERLELGELQKLVLDRLKVVVGQVQPDQDL